MKIESSKPELIEAYILGSVGAAQGFYKHVIQPELQNQPLALYALCGVLGGLVVNRLFDNDTTI